MFRRLVPVLGVLTLSLSAIVPAQAAGRTNPPKKPAIKLPGYDYLRRGLLPGHRYRITVSGEGRVRYREQGFEDYIWIAKGRATEGTKSLTFTGNTPHSFVLKQPVSAHLSQWLLVLTVSQTQARVPKTLKIKLKDLGKS